MSPLKFQLWFRQAKKKLVQQQHRQLVVLVGSKTWAHSLLSTLSSFNYFVSHDTWAIYSEDSLFFSGDNKAFLNKRKVEKTNYRHYLGTQQQYLLFDDQELTIDAFAALSGTINAGGMFFLHWPEPLNNSPLIKQSLFLQRFFQKIITDKNVKVINEQVFEFIDEPIYELRPKETAKSILTNSLVPLNEQILPLGCKTLEQYKAVQAIKKVVSGHRNRPLVLTADRGRGKSSALAIACAQMIKNTQQNITIIISAPHIQAVEIFFRQLATSLEQGVQRKTEFIYQHNNLKNQPISRVTFLPIDILLKDKPQANLLLIDEAAAIPVYLLERVLEYYHRVVFATTQHGYEGAGRGFALKFQRRLQQCAPEHQALHIKQPIRWHEHDPLEQFVFSACLLNAELKPLKLDKINLTNLSLTVHNKANLLQNEKLLAQLFAVLVTAHYQTSPSDLRLMLDNEQVTIISLHNHNGTNTDIVAVALLITEGIDEKDCQQEIIQGIKQGQRRLKDQFLPQSLVTHCGFEQAFDYSYLRIMRVAVHPQLQQQGIGKYFLAQLTIYAQQQHVDFLGTSFGANTALLNFWLKADFKLARIGFTKDQASGEHSALLLKSVVEKNIHILAEVNYQFYRSFHYLLTETYQYLPTQLVALILQKSPARALVKLTYFDQQNITAFSHKKRLYQTCVFSLHLWLLQHLTVNKNHNKDVLLLIARVLQKHSINEICQQFNLTGKKQLNQQLVDYVRKNHKKSLEATENS
jgi:tRNA(Met) cytidine acetyltransferase